MYDDHLYKELTYQIIGIAYSIHKELGPIHKEQVYQKSLANEFQENSIPFKKEVRLPLNTTTQLTYYLKSTGYKVGLLLNFGSPKLQIRRRIYG